jgi:hypothetical protein
MASDLEFLNATIYVKSIYDMQGQQAPVTDLVLASIHGNYTFPPPE